MYKLISLSIYPSLSRQPPRGGRRRAQQPPRLLLLSRLLSDYYYITISIITNTFTDIINIILLLSLLLPAAHAAGAAPATPGLSETVVKVSIELVECLLVVVSEIACEIVGDNYCLLMVCQKSLV